MDSPAFEVLKKAKSKCVRVITLNNKVYRGILEGFDIHVNMHLKDTYVQPDEDKESYIGEVLINGGTVSCVDIV